jgi:hypothetical protein
MSVHAKFHPGMVDKIITVTSTIGSTETVTVVDAITGRLEEYSESFGGARSYRMKGGKTRVVASSVKLDIELHYHVLYEEF